MADIYWRREEILIPAASSFSYCLHYCHGRKPFFFLHKYLDPNCSKAVTALPPSEGHFLVTSQQASAKDFSLKMIWNRQSVVITIKLSWKWSVILALEAQSILNGKNSHLYPSSESSVKDAQYDRNYSDRFSVCCIMLHWSRAGGSLLQFSSSKATRVGNAAKFPNFTRPCHRKSSLREARTFFNFHWKI